MLCVTPCGIVFPCKCHGLARSLSALHSLTMQIELKSALPKPPLHANLNLKNFLLIPKRRSDSDSIASPILPHIGHAITIVPGHVRACVYISSLSTFSAVLCLSAAQSTTRRARERGGGQRYVRSNTLQITSRRHT